MIYMYYTMAHRALIRLLNTSVSEIYTNTHLWKWIQWVVKIALSNGLPCIDINVWEVVKSVCENNTWVLL